VAIQPSAGIRALEPKQAIAKLTALGVKGAKGLRTLQSGRVEVVFTSSDEAKKAKENPIWIKALDPEAKIYEKTVSLRVLRVNRYNLKGFKGNEEALGKENQTRIYKILVSSKKSSSVTLQLTSLTEANKLIQSGLFFEGRAYIYEPWVPVKPTQCFKCGLFGHTATFCKGASKCLTCGKNAHPEKECSQTQRCLNCKGPHASWSSSYKALQAEKAKIAKAYRERPRQFILAKKPLEPPSSSKIFSFPSSLPDPEFQLVQRKRARNKSPPPNKAVFQMENLMNRQVIPLPNRVPEPAQELVIEIPTAIKIDD
jgi:hypothetical protein